MLQSCIDLVYYPLPHSDKPKYRGFQGKSLDTYMATSYNNLRAEVAQSVEQRTENPRVPSSILGLGTKLKAEVAQR